MSSHEALVFAREDEEGVEEARLHQLGGVQRLEAGRAAGRGDLEGTERGMMTLFYFHGFMQDECCISHSIWFIKDRLGAGAVH